MSLFFWVGDLCRTSRPKNGSATPTATTPIPAIVAVHSPRVWTPVYVSGAPTKRRCANAFYASTAAPRSSPCCGPARRGRVRSRRRPSRRRPPPTPTIAHTARAYAGSATSSRTGPAAPNASAAGGPAPAGPQQLPRRSTGNGYDPPPAPTSPEKNERDRVTVDSVRNHAARHFPVQNVARATYRQILERRAEGNGIDFVSRAWPQRSARWRSTKRSW